MDEKKIRVAITHGNTNGVGYELIFKSFADPTMLELCTPIVYGSPKVATYHRKALGIQSNFSIITKAEEAQSDRLNMLACFDEEVKVSMGEDTPESTTAGEKAMKRALVDYQAGLYDVLVTTPITQGKNAAVSFADAEEQPMQMLNSEKLRVALATDDVCLKDVAGKITKDLLLEKITLLHKTLKRDLRIFNPRIAVLALNPDGNGKEEAEAICPAIEEAMQRGIQVFGPMIADEYFGTGAYAYYDAVLAMYHDQGAAPFAAIAGEDCCAMTAGLHLVCTAPMNISPLANAGKGTTDESPLRRAIWLAIDIYRNRAEYDTPLADPLKKLYHEKRDDSEKIRYSMPKKHEKDNPKQEQE